MSIENYVIELLDFSNEAEVLEYEKGLYQGYAVNAKNQWLIDNYEIIDNERMRPNISYDDMTIILIKDKSNGAICGAGSLNYNLNNLQIEQIGLTLPDKDSLPKYCEALNYFLLDTINGEYYLQLLIKAFNFTVNYLKKEGFKIFFSKCERKLLPMWDVMGMDVVGEPQIVAGDECFLLSLNIENE